MGNTLFSLLAYIYVEFTRNMTAGLDTLKSTRNLYLKYSSFVFFLFFFYSISPSVFLVLLMLLVCLYALICFENVPFFHETFPPHKLLSYFMLQCCLTCDYR